ncbi:MAG: heterodisulfide reductase-related iron-sulfur binding cluster, partial [Candidatus Helarchaeota archaeon]
TYSILKKVKADFTISEDEWCCSSPLLRTGQKEHVGTIAEHNMNVVKQIKANKIVFSCAGCFRTFKEDYPKILNKALGIEVLHITEYLYDLLQRGQIKITGKFPYSVTYHDVNC